MDQYAGELCSYLLVASSEAHHVLSLVGRRRTVSLLNSRFCVVLGELDDGVHNIGVASDCCKQQFSDGLTVR